MITSRACPESPTPSLNRGHHVEHDLLPGGQPVLNYVWSVKYGAGKAALTDDVREFFLKNKTILNAAKMGDEELTSDWSLTSPDPFSMGIVYG